MMVVAASRATATNAEIIRRFMGTSMRFDTAKVSLSCDTLV